MPVTARVRYGADCIEQVLLRCIETRLRQRVAFRTSEIGAPVISRIQWTEHWGKRTGRDQSWWVLAGVASIAPNGHRIEISRIYVAPQICE